MQRAGRKIQISAPLTHPGKIHCQMPCSHHYKSIIQSWITNVKEKYQQIYTVNDYKCTYTQLIDVNSCCLFNLTLI